MTQGELADRANVGRKDISRFENGENVTMKTFLRIVGALPNLTRLTIFTPDIVKAQEGEASVDPALQQRPEIAMEKAQEGAPAAPAITAPAEGTSAREMSLLRTIGQLLVEITGSNKP